MVLPGGLGKGLRRTREVSDRSQGGEETKTEIDKGGWSSKESETCGGRECQTECNKPSIVYK